MASRISCCVFVVLCLGPAIAEDGRDPIFTTYGSVQAVKYRPPSSPIDFVYDMAYYIPEALEGQENLKVLVFLHGGGASTNSRQGSFLVIRQYLSDMKAIADELGVVLVMPSGSSLNWGGHMISLLKDLNRTLREDLPIDPDRIGLTGHSMGGMGITRSAHWLADEYAFFMPVAAGMDERHQTESNLRPYFNIIYHHLQGKNDHFDVFLERGKLQEENIERLESEYGRQSGFTMEYHDGHHGYPRELYLTRLKEAFENRRDMFQKELFGKFLYRDDVLNDQWSNGNDYYIGPRDHYFWLQALDMVEGEEVDVTASIDGQRIAIEIDEGVKKLRVFLSPEMVRFDETVEIYVNSELLHEFTPSEKDDAKYPYRSYVDLELPASAKEAEDHSSVSDSAEVSEGDDPV